MGRFKRIAAVLLILSAIGYVVLTFSGRFIKAGIETFAPKILGVKVTVGDVILLPFVGYARISNLKVENLPGYRDRSLFEVGSASVSLELKSLAQETLVIHSITVKSPTIAWEGSISNSNVTKLQEQIGGASPGKGAPDKKVLIETFDIENAKAIVRMGRAQPMVLLLPPIHLEKVRSDRKSEATGKIVAIIVGEIVKQIGFEIARHPELLGDSVGNALGGIVNGVKGLFGK